MLNKEQLWVAARFLDLHGLKTPVRACLPACCLCHQSACLTPRCMTHSFVWLIVTFIGDCDRMTDSDVRILHLCVSSWVVFLVYTNSSASLHPKAKVGQIYGEAYFVSLAPGNMSHLVRMMYDEHLMCSG